MNATVSAIYEQGTLQLLKPLKLPERKKVWVQVLTDQTDIQTLSLKHYLVELRRLLASVTQNWSNDLLCQLFREPFQASLRKLWHLCQPPQREVCSMLILATTHIDSSLTDEQVAAIDFTLDLLEQDTVTDADLDACHERLTEVELPPAFAFNSEIVESYLEEL